MELEEINIPEGIIQKINIEGPFAGITVDAGNRDHIYTNANPELSYEDTLEEIEEKMGYVPVFMRSLPKKVLIHNWSSWKMVDEINMERARYLINTDEISDEKFGQIRV